MADNITLKTYKGGNVTPQDDAIIYETAIPGSGIFKGCEVTYARGNVLHISQGFGMIRGRFFEVYETEIDVRLADVGETLQGRVYIHLDLSNADEPIKILAQAAAELPPLDADVNINYNNSSYDLELAIFTVSSAGLSGLTKVFPTLKAGSGGGGGGGETLTRATSYDLGDAVTAVGAPGWATLVCTQAGTTAAYEPSGYSRITKAGDMVLDGTAVFTARNIIGELDSLISTTGTLEESMQTLDEKVAEMMSSTGLVMKLVSLDGYLALESYSASTIYLCYEDETTKRVTRIFVGEDRVYAAGVKVTYQIDTGYALERIVPDREDAIAAAPDAALEGYTFVGWRQDDSAEKKVLTEYIISSEEPVTLYAVFKKQMTIGLMPNGGTLDGSGSAESFTAYCYYNNGNAQSEPTTVPASPYMRNGMSFCGWSTDSLSTPSYKPGEKGVFPADATLYAMWVTTEYDFPYTGNYVQFVIPQDGIYEFEVWGAAGSAAKGENLVAEGGLGGHSKGYKRMKKDEIVYVYNGGTSGANGGGSGYSYSSSKQYGANGGGSTHVATRSGVLGYGNSSSGLGYNNRNCVLIVAGGGGGGGIENGTAHKGGDGGGERGGDGSDGALGGRQISTGSSPSENFGTGDYYSGSGTCYSGGGGGWFGGNYGMRGQSGAGGSGYIDGVAPFTHKGKYYPAETEAGVNDGNGKAFIRYVECA